MSPKRPRSEGEAERVQRGSRSGDSADRPGDLLNQLLSISLILEDDWKALPESARDELLELAERDAILKRLVEHRLLTTFQANWINLGKITGLMLGNYRVLDRLGAGGMGVVFKAEHIIMRRLAAVKVLLLQFEYGQSLPRFLAEIRAVARLNHPNIVAALDAGKTISPEGDSPDLHYFAMEYIPGLDLDEYVAGNGPMPVGRACDVICQAASGLAEAHRHHLTHRDIKPSNIRLTPDGQVKLLDFGLARQSHDRRLTQPGALLGTLDYMAPEQADDASAVDHRADLYALGGTLYWCLTGQPPFGVKSNLLQTIVARQTAAAPSVRAVRPEVPQELDRVLRRLMSPKPEERFPTAEAVIRALLPYLRSDSREAPLTGPERTGAVLRAVLPPEILKPRGAHRVLLVDDDSATRVLLNSFLQSAGCQCDEVTNGAEAIERLQVQSCDLVLLDMEMPIMSGFEALKALRERPPSPNLKIILLSGGISGDQMSELMAAGADDFLSKPPSLVQLLARVRSALAQKDAEDRSDLLNRHLLAVNAEMERTVSASAGDVGASRKSLILALGEIIARRTGQGGGHLIRLQLYCRCLAEGAALLPAFAAQIDTHFIDMLACCAPLHDLGLAVLPDHILQKPGKLQPDERLIMQTHTALGADILQRIAGQHGSDLAFLQMAIDITRHHHERFDGDGYPDRLAGNAIPLAARLVAVGDVYDALRSRRIHRPALSHDMAVQMMSALSLGQFDPLLMEVFGRCAPQFDRIVRENRDPKF